METEHRNRKSSSSAISTSEFPMPPVFITLSPNTPSPEALSEDEGDSFTNIRPVSTKSNSSQIVNLVKKSESASEIPSCVDFGIQDYLCRADEDFDLSSDTDNSYLDATPPHRFSDGEMDPMPVILNSMLKKDKGCDTCFYDDPFIVSKSEYINQICCDKASRNCAGPLRGILSKSPSNNSLIIVTVPADNHRRHPRPFRRMVSLPAAAFSARLMSSKVNDIVSSMTGNNLQRSDSVLAEAVTRIDHRCNVTASTNASVHSLLEALLPVLSSSGQQSFDDMTDSLSTKGLSADWNDAMEFNSEDPETSAFTTEVERKSLLIRTMRRLVRQDTVGNFAPPDFHI